MLLLRLADERAIRARALILGPAATAPVLLEEGGGPAHAVDEVPAPPLLERLLPGVGQRHVLGSQDVDVAGGVEKHGGFLLALDGEAIALGGLDDVRYLPGGGLVDVEAGDVADLVDVFLFGASLALCG